jgi:hypothetical protein
MPSDIPSTPDRNAALRQLLVSTATTSTITSRRPTRKAAFAAISAFALAGALTGGAVSTVAVTANSQSDPTSSAEFAAAQIMGTHARLIGTPSKAFGTGNTVVHLGSQPQTATGIVLAFDCIDAGKLTVAVDTTVEQNGYCDGGGSAQILPLTAGEPHSITIRSSGSNKYALFAAWVNEPPLPAASAAQTAAIADGTVTQTEYIAAFNRFAGCETAGGYPLAAMPAQYVWYPYAIVDGAVSSGVDARCYASEFKQIDMAWQLSVRSTLDACLTAHGVTNPDTGDLVNDLEKLLPLHLTFDQCPTRP